MDASGRVGEIDEGTTADLCLRQAIYTWDVAGSACRLPDAAVDNNLGHVLRKALTSLTPDEDTSFTYNDEGRTLVLQRLNGSTKLYTTSGYRTQVIETTGMAKVADDTLTGAGAGTARARGCRTQSAVVLSDLTQSLTPNGNAAGSTQLAIAPYLPNSKIHNNSGTTPSAQQPPPIP